MESKFGEQVYLFEQTIDGKKKQKLCDLNEEEAYENIFLCIRCESKTGKVTFQIMKNCKNSKSFKDGDRHTDFVALKKKYEPKSALSRLNLMT